MSDTIKTVLIACTILVSVCLAWFFILYQPEVSKLQKIKEETDQLLFKLQSLRVTEAQVNSLEKQVDIIRSEISLTRDKIISKDDLQPVINIIRKKGRRFGLKFLKIIPDYPSLIGTGENGEIQNSEVLKLTVHFKLQGYYKNFGKFLGTLDQLPFYLSLSEMTLVYNEAVHPQIDIMFDAILYLRGSGNSKT